MNGEQPFFSVVIPLYNKGPHVSRSVGSVVRQTYSSLELIVVDDASTDESVNKVLEFSDKRIRIIHRDKPGRGGYAARNLGLRESKGQWIALLDADDEWDENHLQKYYELIKQFPEVNVLGCGRILRAEGNEHADRYYRQHYLDGNHIITLEMYLKYCILKARPLHSSVVCLKANSPGKWHELFPEDERIQRNGDLVAWLRLLCKNKKMAWSNHIGALQHIDSVNRVSVSALGTPYLFQRAMYYELSQSLNRKEKKQLRVYFNRLLKSAWLGNIIRGYENFKLYKHIYWYGDIFNASKMLLMSFLPEFIIRDILIKRVGKAVQ